jgi:FkbM family methyltransferase
MPSDVFRTKIRGAELVVDAEYENQIGVYGPEFWNGISTGEYETETFDFLDGRAKSGSCVLIDVGSATGCMVLYAASLGMHAVGTEPQNLVFEGLRRNVALNAELMNRISIHHALVGTDSRAQGNTEQFFTHGANGPLKKEIVPNQISLESLMADFSLEDKISVKIDIEGAEYPLLSRKETLQSLKHKKATVFLSFHPGFNRNLGANPSFIKLLAWRLQALIETLRFVAKLQKYSSISLLHSNSKLGLLSVITHLIKDQKDFILTF